MVQTLARVKSTNSAWTAKRRVILAVVRPLPIAFQGGVRVHRTPPLSVKASNRMLDFTGKRSGFGTIIEATFPVKDGIRVCG